MTGRTPSRRRLRQNLLDAQILPAEVSDLEALLAAGLDEEVAMLRVAIRRMMRLAHGAEQLDEAIEVMTALGKTASQLAGLLKARQALAGPQEPALAGALSKALNEVVTELGLGEK